MFPVNQANKDSNANGSEMQIGARLRSVLSTSFEKQLDMFTYFINKWFFFFKLIYHL